jgi:hypothetical protein
MATLTEIYNRAAQKLGAKRITSIDENSTIAQELRTCAESVLEACLMSHRWSFAIKRAEIAADDPTPDWGRSNAFSLPDDCLLVIPPYPEQDEVFRDWVLEGRKIITNYTAPLHIRYVSKVTDPNLMDSLFREYYATMLAFELCEKITQSNTKKDGFRYDLDDIVNKAKKQNAIQSVPIKSPDDTWLAVRN